jgi:hypothetical protein
MERVFLEASIGTVVVGGALLFYLKKVKKRLRKRILRDFTSR